MKLVKVVSILAVAAFFTIAAIEYAWAQTYVYQQNDNPNYHMHVHFGQGITVAWFQLNPQVRKIGGWRCSYTGRDHVTLECKNPTEPGVTQWFKLSQDRKVFSRGQTVFTLIKVAP